MNLSILIPTVLGREKEFNRLFENLSKQIFDNNLESKIEILSLKDNKEISIGLKRDKLYNMANGLFSVMIDDDDLVPDDYCFTVNEVIESHQVDCIGYFENCLINGNQQKSVISRAFHSWSYHEVPKNGYHYYRTPFFKVPIKTDICKKVGVKDMRFGEDHEFAIRIYPELKTEYFIYREMYFYRANNLTKEQHDKRYGFTK